MRQGISPRELAQALDGLGEFYARMDTCDLGEYIEHPDGTLEALPADHGRPQVSYYASLPPASPVSPLWVDTRGMSVQVRTVRKVASPYAVTGLTAPQPAPRYTVLRWGRQIRTGAPQ